MTFLTAEEIQQIELFKEKVEDLVVSQKKYQTMPICSFSRDEVYRANTFKANTPDIDHILNLAIKFRFFYAQKEPTYFENILNLLRQRAIDEWAINYIDRIKLRYKQVMSSTDTTGSLGHPITNRKIIDIWFNSQFFHSDFAKRQELINIHESIGEQPSIFQLYLAIVKCSSQIRSLYVAVHKLTQENQVLFTPSHHFRLDYSTNKS